MPRPFLLLLTALLVAATQSTDLGQVSQGRSGSGHELARSCRLYFDFLGRTGAGRAETFDQDPFGMGYCAGLVRGAATTATALSDTVCLPDDLTAARGVYAVIQYLDSQTDSLYEQDATLVLRALQASFPCR